MPESIKDLAIAAAAVITGLWMAMLSWVARREVLRIDGKADRSEVTALADRIEKNHDALMARIDKTNDEASAKRDKMYEKIDRLAEAVHRSIGPAP